MSNVKQADIKVRVPQHVKDAFATLADGDFTTESEIVRRALYDYLREHGYSPEFLRTGVSGTGKLISPMSVAAPATALMFNEPVNSGSGQVVAGQTVGDALAHAAASAPLPPTPPGKYPVARRSKKKLAS